MLYRNPWENQMPELPEVETIVRDLATVLPERRIEGVEIEWPGVLEGLPVEAFREMVVGRRIEHIARRAKFIIIYLDNGTALSIHLRMTGRLFYRPTGSEPDRFTKAILVLDGGYELRFADMRKFGRILVLQPEHIQALQERLGPEPLSEGFTVDVFAHLLAKHPTKIKALLLDQSFIAGIGNIYADESLFVAGIHPERPANELSPAEVERLYYAIRQVLNNSIINRGTTFSTFVDAHGEQGGHQRALLVYHRHGQPCPKCGTVLERMQVAQRGTHYCPLCQPSANPQNTKPLPSRSRRASGRSKAG
jgi:formamidopyrimidine-DNA glycosylase